MLLSRHQTHTQSHRYPDPHFFSFEFDFPALSKKKKAKLAFRKVQLNGSARGEETGNE